MYIISFHIVYVNKNSNYFVNYYAEISTGSKK